MERDIQGRPTRFDAGDYVTTSRSTFVLNAISASRLNIALQTKILFHNDNGTERDITVVLRPTGSRNKPLETFPVRQVLIDTGAIEAS